MTSLLSAERVLFHCTKLRCFVSFDIIGSTEYKQQQGPISSDWSWLFEEFISESKTALIQAWDLIKFKAAEENLEFQGDFTFWQFRGDEVVFTKLLDAKHLCLSACLISAAAMLALKRVRRFLEYKAKLDVKATIWLAGFPINNAEVILDKKHNYDSLSNTAISGLIDIAELRERSDGDGIENLTFIGPSIDLGFRLCAHATRRKTVISPDLAFLIVTTSSTDFKYFDNITNSEIKILPFYRENVALKGVYGGNEFPLVWLDSEFDQAKVNINNARDSIWYGANNPDTIDDPMVAFLKAFLDSEAPIHTQPYIAKSEKTEPVRTPQHHAKRRMELLDEIDIELKRRDQSEPSPLRRRKQPKKKLDDIQRKLMRNLKKPTP